MTYRLFSSALPLLLLVGLSSDPELPAQSDPTNADYLLCVSGKRGEEKVTDACTRLTWTPALPKALLVDAYLSRAFNRIAMGRGLEALSDCRKASVALELVHKDGRAANCFGWVYYKLGHYELGLPHAHRAILAEPDQPAYWDTRAHLYEGLGRKVEAMANYHRAIGLSPGYKSSAEGLNRLGKEPAPKER
jgi:tetratricopeptide (TPR) repeat protein